MYRRVVRDAVRKVPYVKALTAERDDLLTDKGILQLEKGNLEADVRALKETIKNARTFLAQRYIKGSGIEIGPTYLPVKLPRRTTVKYVDEAPLEELYRRYPELKKLDMAPVDIVDNAEKLTKVKNNSIDFIIANHFIEHTLDPIGTLIVHQKKLRKNGVLFYAIPDKRYTFDIQRAITTYEHLLEEHHHPTVAMKYQHFLEAAEWLELKKGKEIAKRAAELMEMRYSIHYHVWTRADLIELFTRTIKDFSLPLEIVCVFENNPESIFILKKTT